MGLPKWEFRDSGFWYRDLGRSPLFFSGRGPIIRPTASWGLYWGPLYVETAKFVQDLRVRVDKEGSRV